MFDKNTQQCLMCANRDFPTGMHCQLCKKAFHLFGCSVPADKTEEGCGEAQICLQCNNGNKSIDIENKTIENWKGKGTPKISQPKKRSAKSYLNKQPEFKHVTINKIGINRPIIHLKMIVHLIINPF